MGFGVFDEEFHAVVEFVGAVFFNGKAGCFLGGRVGFFVGGLVRVGGGGGGCGGGAFFSSHGLFVCLFVLYGIYILCDV